MEDFNSKYTGQQVEDLLDQVASGNAGGGGDGGITVETDPIFSASPAAAITEDDIAMWNGAADLIEDHNTDISQLFNDIEGKQDAISDEKIAEWDSKYAKPSGGIPKSDLTQEVQNALRYAEQDRGTVNKIKVNGKNIGANNGVVDLGNLGTYSTYIADFTMEALRDGIYNGTNIDCNTQALVTAMNANKIILVREGEDSAYKGVYVLNGYVEDLLYFSIVNDLGNILWCEGTQYGDARQIDAQSLHQHNWWEKQDILVSGENIKTINGESIVGSGNITIAGANGKDGATFTPSVDSAGNLSWTNDKGLTNPPTVNIKGPKGDAGEGGGGSSGEDGVETISLSGGLRAPLIIEEMLAEKRYYLYIDEDVDGNDDQIVIMGFEGDGVVDGAHIRHFYAVIECVSANGGAFNVSLSLPDVNIRWSTGTPIPIEGEGRYELSITQVIDSGYAYYNGVLTSFSQS